MTTPSHHHPILLSLLALGALTFAACDNEEPLEDNRRAFGDFGTEMYQIIHDELLWSNTQAVGESRAIAFQAHRAEIAWALNQAIAEPVSSQMLPLLEQYLPLYDDRADGSAGPMPKMTRDAAEIINSFVSDPRTLEAMAQLDVALAPNPYAVERLIGNLIRHPVALIDPMAEMTLSLEPQLTELFRWLHRELPTLEDDYVEREDELSLLQRLVQTQLAVATEPIGPPTMSASFDGRGAPEVQRLPDGQLPPPFVDSDLDGQPDVDAFGRPVDALGVPILIPTFSTHPTSGEQRDQLGRAMSQGQLMYRYFDLRRSAAAFLLRDARTMLERGYHYDLFTAFEALLGGRVNRNDQDGSFTGFFVEASPLLDLLHILNELRRYPRLPQLVAALGHVANNQEPVLRQLIGDFARARRIFDGAPDLAPGNSLFEEIHDALASIASVGGFRDYFAADALPQTQGKLAAMAAQMRHTRLDLPQDLAVLTRPEHVDALGFENPTPWAEPDTADSQRSMMQKAAYLMADTSQAPVYLTLFDQVVIEDVVVTHDMAMLYVEAIANVARLDLGDEFLEDLALNIVSEFDDRNLSAEELNLYMNHDQPATGNPVCRQGFKVRQHYGTALLSLQASGGLRTLRPWVTEIVKKGQQQPFIQIFVALAKHYSETIGNSGGITSAGTGFRKLEPYLVEVFETTGLDEHLSRLNAWMHRADFAHGGQTLNVADELDGFIRYLFDQEAMVARRDGSFAIPSKLGGAITKPSRLQLIIDAFDGIDAALDSDPAARAAWERVDLLGLMLDLDGNNQFVNQHALDLIITMLPILADDAAQAVTQPDWLSSIDTFTADLEEVMGGRGFAAAADVVRDIRNTPQHKAFVDSLTSALFAEQPASVDADVFGTLLQVLSGFAQVRIPSDATTQMLRSLGTVLDPAKRLVFSALETLQTLRGLDGNRVTTALAANLFFEPEFGRFPFRILKDAFKLVLRTEPGAPGPYSAADFEQVLGGIADWMTDEDKGMERLYEVIRSR